MFVSQAVVGAIGGQPGLLDRVTEPGCAFRVVYLARFYRPTTEAIVIHYAVFAAAYRFLVSTLDLDCTPASSFMYHL